MTSGASTAGSTLPTEAKGCCKKIAARAGNIRDKRGGSEGRPLPPIIGPIVVRGNRPGNVVAGRAIRRRLPLLPADAQPDIARRQPPTKYSPRELRPLSEDSARQVPPPGIHPLVRTHP